jgi:hypothetical protein
VLLGLVVEKVSRERLDVYKPGGIALDATLSASAGCHGA